MKRLLFVVGAAAVLTMTSCSKEESLDGGPQAAGGHLVSLTLNGSAGMPGPVSRAASGQTLAATDAEKKISSLLAVAFNKGGDAGGKLYDVFEVNISGSEYSFDMKKSGAFDVWFVANADETCKNAIMGLEVGTATADELNKVISSQAPDVDDQFLMVSVDSKEIRTNDGATTKVTVTMQRASVRFDIVNAIDGITITKVEFKNRANNSRIATPNNQSDFAEAAYDSKTYEGLSLVGYTPTGSPEEDKVAASKYEAKIYSYEHLNEQDGANPPSLLLTYTVKGLDGIRTHEVKFHEPETSAQMQLKRNHLYRIILNEKHSDMTIAGKVTVTDWTEAEEFSFNDLPFEKDLNASLQVNRFASKNVDESGLIYTDNQFGFSADNTPTASAYEAFMDAWTSGKYVDKNDQHGTKYRVPTKDEWMLLLPEKTDASSDCPFVCFQTGKMTASAFSENIQIGDMPISGQSYLTYDDGDKAVYALRFMGTEQAAAYCYKFDPSTGLSIKIIGLGKEGTAQIGEVKSMAWSDPTKYIEITLPANGYYASSDATKANLLEENTKGYYWSASQEDMGTNNAWYVSFDANEAFVTTTDVKGNYYTLRMIADYDTPVVSK